MQVLESSKALRILNSWWYCFYSSHRKFFLTLRKDDRVPALDLEQDFRQSCLVYVDSGRHTHSSISLEHTESVKQGKGVAGATPFP